MGDIGPSRHARKPREHSSAFTIATLGMVGAELELRQVVPVLQASCLPYQLEHRPAA
jgi:hypothetical protein